MLLWNAHDRSERFNAPDTVKVQWTVRVGAGLLLLSDMGRTMASITGDMGARHDLLTGGSTAASNARRYGPGPWRNTRDNFRLAAGKHGLDRRDIPPCLTLFADIRTDGEGVLDWHGPCAPGAAIDMRMEMDVAGGAVQLPPSAGSRPGLCPPIGHGNALAIGPARR